MMVYEILLKLNVSVILAFLRISVHPVEALFCLLNYLKAGKQEYLGTLQDIGIFYLNQVSRLITYDNVFGYFTLNITKAFLSFSFFLLLKLCLGIGPVEILSNR